MYFGKFEEDISEVQLKSEYREAIDIFPALHKYQAEHSEDNFKKLCIETAEFCRAIYASTKTDAEREIYRRILGGVLK